MRRFMGFPQGADATGEIESMPLLAGQSAGLVNEIKAARQIVEEMVEGARRIIEELLFVAETHAHNPEQD